MKEKREAQPDFKFLMTGGGGIDYRGAVVNSGSKATNVRFEFKPDRLYVSRPSSPIKIIRAGEEFSITVAKKTQENNDIESILSISYQDALDHEQVVKYKVEYADNNSFIAIERINE